MRRTTYYGDPCARCGGTKRYTSNRGCYACVNSKATAYQKAYVRLAAAHPDEFARYLADERQERGVA